MDSTDTGVAQAIPINPVRTSPLEQNRRNMTSATFLSKSPHIWLSKLAACKKFNKLTDNDVIDDVPWLLEGSAGSWFQTLSTTQYTTIQDFQDSLKDRANKQEQMDNVISLKFVSTRLKVTLQPPNKKIFEFSLGNTR